MTSYRPDIYGETPPAALWSVFHFIAKRWALAADEKASVLGEEVEPVGSPPPGESAKAHIELMKDCYLLVTGAQETVGDKDGTQWVRRPMPVFNNLSPLDLMTRTPEFLQRNIKPYSPQVAHLWQREDGPNPTIGLELVRSLFTFNKPDISYPGGPERRLAELVAVSLYKPR